MLLQLFCSEPRGVAQWIHRWIYIRLFHYKIVWNSSSGNVRLEKFWEAQHTNVDTQEESEDERDE